MNATPSVPQADAILSSEELNASRAAWTLDELDHSTDLASLHVALASPDDR